MQLSGTRDTEARSNDTLIRNQNDMEEMIMTTNLKAGRTYASSYSSNRGNVGPSSWYEKAKRPVPELPKLHEFMESVPGVEYRNGELVWSNSGRLVRVTS